MNKWIWISAAVVGAIAGYLYWYFIGCNSGTCAITSNWHNSSIYGGIMGLLLGNIVTDYRKKKITPKDPGSKNE